MGIELNPQMGENFDFKLFTNGRVGMMSWLIVCVGLFLPSHFSLQRHLSHVSRTAGSLVLVVTSPISRTNGRCTGTCQRRWSS